jgi:hypothetical protein
MEEDPQNAGYIDYSNMNSDDESEQSQEDNYEQFEQIGDDDEPPCESEDEIDEELERRQRMVEEQLDRILEREFRDHDFFYGEHTVKYEETNVEENAQTQSDEDETDFTENVENTEQKQEQTTEKTEIVLPQESINIIQNTMKSITLTPPEWVANFDEKDWMKIVLKDNL